MDRQVGDNLIYEGNTYQLLGEEVLPENDNRVIELTDEQCKSLEFDVTNTTACMRGYKSSWEIKKDRLYLICIKGRYKLTTADPVLADWYTDVIIIPTGKRLHKDIETQLSDIYEGEIHLHVEKGIVISSETIDRREEYKSFYDGAKNNYVGLKLRILDIDD